MKLSGLRTHAADDTTVILAAAWHWLQIIQHASHLYDTKAGSRALVAGRAPGVQQDATNDAVVQPDASVASSVVGGCIAIVDGEQVVNHSARHAGRVGQAVDLLFGCPIAACHLPVRQRLRSGGQQEGRRRAQIGMAATS